MVVAVAVAVAVGVGVAGVVVAAAKVVETIFIKLITRTILFIVGWREAVDRHVSDRDNLEPPKTTVLGSPFDATF